MEAATPPVIQSLQNPRIKHALKLRDAKTRRRSGEYLIDGFREIARAIDSGFPVVTIFFESGTELTLELKTSLEQLRSRQTAQLPRVQPVTHLVMSKLSYGDRETSSVAVARTPDLPLSELKLSRASLVLVLDRTEKPGNLGACLRTAAACGADAVVLTNPICEVFNPNTIRSSRGTLFAVPIAVAEVSEFTDLAQQLSLPILAARVDGKQSLWECDFRKGAAVLFGNEAQGLGEDWRLAATESFQIPMSKRADSLNVSISAAVTLYEALRQRTVCKFDQ